MIMFQVCFVAVYLFPRIYSGDVPPYVHLSFHCGRGQVVLLRIQHTHNVHAYCEFEMKLCHSFNKISILANELMSKTYF